MAEWESEIAALLRSLDVSYGDDSQPDATAREDPSPDVEAIRDELEDEALLSLAERSGPQETASDEPASAVSREIEATLTRVIQLTRAGQLDRALRDDVVFVLRALTRPQPAAQDDEPDEWHLASAAAVLHFCRVVTRLTRPLAQENGL